MKFLFALGLLASATCVLANPTVLVETPVTYSTDAKVTPAIRAECRLDSRLVLYANKPLRRANRRSNTTIAANGSDSRPATLRMQIVEVIGEGAVQVNGTRAITVQASLLQGGVVSRKIKLTRSTVVRSMAGMPFPEDVCPALWRCAGAISRTLVRWATNPDATIAADANVPTDDRDDDDAVVNAPTPAK
jgi:hypothetical protein